MNDLETIDWFVIKVRFQRAVMAQARLNKPDIEVFLPMEVREVATKCGGKCVKQVPIFSDMMFVKSSFRRISELCAAYKDMYYQSAMVGNTKKAIRIPEDQMSAFKDFILENYESIECKIAKLKSGKKITLKSGIFKGSTIIFKEEKGTTTKKYKININGIDWDFMEDALVGSVLSGI